MFTDSKYKKWYFSIIENANKLAKKLAAGV
jgi:hypothetical protein